jgi:hypothetical protein
MSAHIKSNLRGESIKPNWSKIENFLSNKTKVLQYLLNFNSSHQTPPYLRACCICMVNIITPALPKDVQEGD